MENTNINVNEEVVETTATEETKTYTQDEVLALLRIIDYPNFSTFIEGVSL